jgi:beta-fructofuranosidase
MTDPPEAVGFLHDGPRSAEQAAALEWLDGTSTAAEPVRFDALADAADRFDALWWHREAPLEASPSPLSAHAPAVERHLASGGGLLLTLRAMADVDALGIETVPPDAVGTETVADPTGVLWRRLHDDHPAVESFDDLRLRVCDRGAVGAAAYESILPARGEVLASTVRGDHDVPHRMPVVGWDVDPGSVLGVGAPLSFDRSAAEAVAATRDRLVAGCLAAVADDVPEPSRPRDAGEMAAMRRALDADDRPTYHVTAPANWLNDPNGLVRWNGRFHVFYQYNPAGPFHDTIHWGHATSEDLVRWRDEPVALSPSPDGPDRDGCWSGCAIDDDGTPTLLYTGGDGRRQLPCLAIADDDALRRWEKHPDNPVIEAPPADVDVLETEHWEAEFRDHCVWREAGRWQQIIGTGLVDRGGAALRYSSEDLREWRYEGPLLVGEWASDGTVWECPELLDLGDRRLLHVSNCEDVVYFLGELRDGRFAVDRQGTLDHGDFYAPQSLADGDRHVTFGWLPEARDLDAQWDAGWSGALSLPRVLSVGPDGDLRQRPAAEVERLRTERLLDGATFELSAGERRRLDVAGRTLELDLEVRLRDAAAAELSVFESPDRAERTTLRYGRDGELVVDRTAASDDSRVTADTQRMAVPPHDEPLSLRCFLDRSVLEVYANGRHCLTSRIYPTRDDSVGVSLAADDGRATVRDLSVWRLGDGYPRSPPDDGER